MVLDILLTLFSLYNCFLFLYLSCHSNICEIVYESSLVTYKSSKLFNAFCLLEQDNFVWLLLLMGLVGLRFPKYYVVNMSLLFLGSGIYRSVMLVLL